MVAFKLQDNQVNLDIFIHKLPASHQAGHPCAMKPPYAVLLPDD